MSTIIEAAEKLARDILSNNLLGLMTSFTPSGMAKALAVQAQSGGTQGATDFVVADQGENVVHITFRAPDGEGTIRTRWVRAGDGWKVDDMAALDG